MFLDWAEYEFLPPYDDTEILALESSMEVSSIPDNLAP
jgi:hypothetical protein